MIIDNIKADRLTNRKKGIKDPYCKAVAVILTTLYGELTKVEKDTGKQLPDARAVKIVNKFIKGVADKANHRPLTVSELNEIEIYRQYVPKLLNDEEITKFVYQQLKDVDNPSMRLMGAIMQNLKDEYPGMVDGKQASAIIKSLL